MNLTEIPTNAAEIAKKECGIIVRYKKEDISNAVVGLLKDSKKLNIFKLNSYNYSRKFEWDKIFAKALNEKI